LDYENKIEFDYVDLDEAFPPCDPGFAPSGSAIMVQIRTAKKKTKGGIILVDDVRETEIWNTQIGKVIGIGPVAFRNRNTMELWPEGAWYSIGDFIRVPKYGGDRWTVPTTDGQGQAIIALFNDLDSKAVATGDPTKIKAFL